MLVLSKASLRVSNLERFRLERLEYTYSLVSSSRGVSENVRNIIPLIPCNSGLGSLVGGSTSCERNRKEINSETETVRFESVERDEDIVKSVEE